MGVRSTAGGPFQDSHAKETFSWHLEDMQDGVLSLWPSTCSEPAPSAPLSGLEGCGLQHSGSSTERWPDGMLAPHPVCVGLRVAVTPGCGAFGHRDAPGHPRTPSRIKKKKKNHTLAHHSKTDETKEREESKKSLKGEMFRLGVYFSPESTETGKQWSTWSLQSAERK